MRRFLLTFVFILAALPAFSQGVQVTQVGAIYAIGSKLLQRIYIPSFNNNEIDQQFIGGGEALLKVPLATYKTGGPVAVQAAVGTPTFSGRSAVVHKDTRVVLDVIIADPALYADPNGHSIIPDDKAMIGDTWDGANFFRRYVEINPHAPNVLTSIVTTTIQPINNSTPTVSGDILMFSTTLNVGDPIPAALFQKIKSLP